MTGSASPAAARTRAQVSSARCVPGSNRQPDVPTAPVGRGAFHVRPLKHEGRAVF